MKKIWLVLIVVALLIAPVAAKSNTIGAATTKYAVGVNLGWPTNGVAFQYKMSNSFDLIGDVSLGSANGNWLGWVGGDVGVNFKVADFDWTDGSWFLTVGAVGQVGFILPDSNDNNGGFHLAALAPVRLNYQFPKAPWSFYLMLGPGLDIFPTIGFTMGGALGALYLFN
ncbi:MAG: hypothetical protein LKE39_02850 [Sphaerochaeta sp.]|jgi:hypothetical protein|nr:hypothetical protein [Sphaerochaeta sp.]MCH3919420.1 hypothetical protein [Sphaerochaeta sp.]